MAVPVGLALLEGVDRLVRVLEAGHIKTEQVSEREAVVVVVVVLVVTVPPAF